jgi:dolichol-phosphate mannosyltransferase
MDVDKLYQNRVCVVLPTFNEEHNVYEVVSNILAYNNDDNLKVNIVVCIVDDGSTDNTWKIIKNVSEHFPGRIIGRRFSRNFGKDAAILSGLTSVHADSYIVMDSDGQHPIELLPVFIKKWREENFDIVNGIKFERSSDSLFQLVSSRLFNHLFRSLTGLNLSESSDFKLLSAKAVLALTSCGDQAPFFRALTLWIGLKQTDIKFKVKERKHGRSRWVKKALLAYAFNGFLLFSYAPLYILIVLSLIAFCLTFILGLKLLLDYLQGETPSGYATLLGLALLSLSMNMMAIGVLGLYVKKVLDHVKQRPRFIVMEELGKID